MSERQAKRMAEQNYKRITGYVRSRDGLRKVLVFVYKYLPYPVFVAYPALLAVLFVLYLQGRVGLVLLIKEIAIPAGAFLLITLFRKLFNKRRPYEKYNFEPIVKKNKTGESFPSRHAGSVFIIAMGFLYVNIPLGVIFLSIGVIMSLSRVLCGVHFPKDVISGAVFSILVGWIFFFLI